MSEQALDTHLQSQERRPPEEMVEIEKDYLMWLETINAKLLEALKKAAYMICLLCRRLNPQHTDCTQCDDIDNIRKAIRHAEEQMR